MTILAVGRDVDQMVRALTWQGVRLEDSSPRLIDADPPAEETEGMTLSAALPTGSSAYETKSDDATTPPMEALGRIAAVRARLDEGLSQLIGRMQPYLRRDVAEVMTAIREGTPSSAPDPRSPLIARMDDEAAQLMELVQRVEELLRDVEL